MRHLPDVFAIIGAILVLSGVGMMHIPSAFILAGIAFGYVGYRTTK